MMLERVPMNEPRAPADPQTQQLMLAAYHGHADLVDLLIQHGANPNRINDRGQSPLAGAVFKKEDRVIEVGRVCYPGSNPRLTPGYVGPA